MKRLSALMATALLGGFAFLLATPSAVFAQEDVKSVPLPPPPAPASRPQASVEALTWVQKQIAAWPEKTRRLASQLITKYGVPADHSDHELNWYNNGVWKRTTLYREEFAHNFANAHKDVLEQVVNYRVPLDKFGALAEFNGSVVPNRTRGELASAADSEETNFLALNVADELVKGERDVDQARTYFAQIIRAKMINEPEPYLQALRFKPAPATQTADADEVAPLIRHMSGRDK